MRNIFVDIIDNDKIHIFIDFVNIITLLLLDRTRRCQTTISIGGKKYEGAATWSASDER